MDNEAFELEALEHIMSDASAEPMKLSYGLLRSITDDFSIEIGRGGFGVVYQGVLQNGDVAVKKLMNLHALTEKQYLDEITCLKKAKHKNIVRFLGYCSETQGELYELNGANVMAEVQQKLLCFEYVPNGDIKNYLQQEKSDGDDWPLRYQMIRGICQGLHYLHSEHINHLDLKPENVILDAHMQPKITDFGLSRCLDQGQSKIITQNILGTLRYIAPETIDNGEISFKSDIYALGIIIIELLTGINKIDLDNWDESLDDMDCPRLRRCTEIARNCTDRDRHNRPTIVEVISDLDELESMIPQSSMNQVAPITFPWSEKVDVYPLELSFPFVPNKEMHCRLSVTNKTNDAVLFAIKPAEYPERYHGGEISFKQYFSLMPKSTIPITVYRRAVEVLSPYTDKLEINILITGLSPIDTLEKLSTLSSESSTPVDVTFEVAQRLGFELQVEMLTVVFDVSEEDDRTLVVDTTCWEKGGFRFDSMDVHPTEPWVLVVGYASAFIVYIWNWETNEKMGEYKSSDGYTYTNMVAQFIPRKQWVVIGNSDGSILVRMCPTMHHVKAFKAHRWNVTSLAVHPTRPYLLSSDSMSLKLWDWNHDWFCTRIFEVNAPVRRIMFNPKHATMFATVHQDGKAMMWRLSHPDPISMNQIFHDDKSLHLFTYVGDRDFLVFVAGQFALICDFQKDEHVHTIRTEQNIVAIICHPTCPRFVTVSLDGFIQVWDSITYRLKRTYVNLRTDPLHIGFTRSSRLVIGNEEGITVMNIDLE